MTENIHAQKQTIVSPSNPVVNRMIKPNFKELRNRYVYDLHKKGLSYNEISKDPQVNVTPQRVARIIKRFKVFLEQTQQ